MNHLKFARVASLLVIVAFCLFEILLYRNSGIFSGFELTLTQQLRALSVCVVVWFGVFLYLTFSLDDLPLISLLVVAIIHFIIGVPPWPATDAITLLFGATLGKAVRFALISKKDVRGSDQRMFLTGLIVLLLFSSWWHLKMFNLYRGPRWMGLWDNPNDYGILMSVGVLVAVGFLADRRWKLKDREEKKMKFRIWILILMVAVFMMGVGLIFSYSRGAWLGTAIGLLYLAKAHSKFKWRYVLPMIFVVAAIVCLFWNATPNTAPWYFQRLDLSRGSAQHRVAAWKASLEMMRDHPFGVGWNKAVDIYGKNYSPPEGSASAITTNDYLMLGTQLGIPALVCFVAYVALQLGIGGKFQHLILTFSPPRSGEGMARVDARPTVALDATQVACRAAIIAMLVEFWYDGGLFKLATASVFWILLELSQVQEFCG